MKTVPLKRVATLSPGGTPDTSNDAYWDENGTPWISISDMSSATYVESTAKGVTRAGLNSAGLRARPAGTVLFAMYASVGKVAITATSAVWNQALLGIVPDTHSLHNKYLYYNLLSLQNELPALFRSNTQNNLNADQVSNFKICCPSLGQQNRIADYLDRETAEIDAFIKDQTRFYELLSERDITTMALVRDSNSRSAPLRRFGSITLGKMVASARANEAAQPGVIVQPYLRAASVQPQGLLVLGQNIKEMPFTSTESRTLTLHRGDVVVVEGGAGFGRSAVLDQDLPGWGFQNSINRIRVSPDAADPHFIHYNLQLMLALGELDFIVNQATIPHLTADKLASCPIAYKPLDQQKQISRAIQNELNRNNAFRADIQASIDLAHERRAALITAAVTGQIDVTARHKPAAEQLEDDIAQGLHREN